MKRVKRRRFSGVVCEQIVYNVSDRVRDIKHAKPRLRFKDEAERELHRTMISRRHHASLVNANFSPTSLYSTLTFDMENEVHNFDEARIIRDRYFRRLKYAYPDAVIFIYMGRGKATHRIHFHMISEGVPKEYIYKQWTYGRVERCDNLREHCFYDKQDHGQDYTGLANYCFDHWTPEVGGHRWKMTRNARKPEVEDATECKRDYSEQKPPRAPKGYVLMETKATKYGYLYFKYVKQPPKYVRKKPKSKAAQEGS